ncbi:MAG: gliding motility-associated C-terminal domain-containing protein, partial [Pedobacter sp.]|uniref:T9SS type B sorting domain-containing protein n=1 Tax=Pedobacter sp. TaxID=1411316 RepID=UPI003565AB34
SISRTPSEFGYFEYTVTTVSNCNPITTTGTLRIKEATKITLSSAFGTDAQNTCINSPITDITYDITNATTVKFTGLPTGVTGNFVNNVATISGTSADMGTFTYTITTTGECQSPTVTGTITVGLEPTITLTSAVGSDGQSGCEGIAITPITYAITQATNATVTGLPAGVTPSFSGGILTISGIPTQNGFFEYTITTVGNCNPVTTTGILRIKEATKITLSSAFGTDAQTTCVTSSITNITYDITNATTVQITGLPTGITGNFINNVATISGTSASIGTFTYTISATGVCQSPMTTGTITIGVSPTITLTSAVGTDGQSGCEGIAITPITYAITQATNATVTGLPAGITPSFSGGILTISGIPTQNGYFDYTITTIGGCSPVTTTGVLRIKAATKITLSSAIGTDQQTTCLNTPITTITYDVTNSNDVQVNGLPAGFTYTYVNNVVTITGSSAAIDIFNYTVSAVGVCQSPTVTGTITIGALPTLTLTSAVGSNFQSVCEDVNINPITIDIANASGANLSGLPVGITGQYNAGTFTISGKSQTSGVFPFTITTLGGCSDVSFNGTITITESTKITLSSGVSTDSQTTCINSTINNITYDIINANPNSVQITGLPAGITSNLVNNVVTISGASASIGTFTYTISAIGVCQSPTVTGTITIGVAPNITLTSVAGSDFQSVCKDVAINTISFAINNAPGATISELPIGITGQYNAGIFTISGKSQAIGTFPFIITTVGGCSNVIYNGTITVTENTKLQLTSNLSTISQKLCFGSPIIPITYNFTATKVTVTGLPTGLTAILTGVYPNGILTISGTPTQTGNFNYTIDATGTCIAASANGSINIVSPSAINLTSANGSNFQSACEGVKITDITYQIINATGAVVTGLPTGVTGTYLNGVFTITGTPTVNGTFSYQVSTAGGCNTVTANGVLNVKIGTQLNLTSLPSTAVQNICIGKPIVSINYSGINATNITVTGLPNGLTTSYLNGVMKIEGIPSVTGSFNYIATAIGDCASPSLIGNITILALPTPIIQSDLGSNINKGDVATLSVANGTNFTWMPAADIISGQGTSNIIVRPDQTTTYTVEVSNAAGCIEIGEITLVVNPSIKVIPGNIITPDGNGKNDYWTIKNIEYFPENNVKIFDRAGRVIYDKKGYKNDWDATYNGKPLNEDAYLYVIDLGIGQGLVRGTITIVRNHN